MSTETTPGMIAPAQHTAAKLVGILYLVAMVTGVFSSGALR